MEGVLRLVYSGFSVWAEEGSTFSRRGKTNTDRGRHSRPSHTRRTRVDNRVSERLGTVYYLRGFTDDLRVTLSKPVRFYLDTSLSLGFHRAISTSSLPSIQNPFQVRMSSPTRGQEGLGRYRARNDPVRVRNCPCYGRCPPSESRLSRFFCLVRVSRP